MLLLPSYTQRRSFLSVLFCTFDIPSFTFLLLVSFGKVFRNAPCRFFTASVRRSFGCNFWLVFSQAGGFGGSVVFRFQDAGRSRSSIDYELRGFFFDGAGFTNKSDVYRAELSNCRARRSHSVQNLLAEDSEY